MNFEKETCCFVTIHNGKFHADEVVACALINNYVGKIAHITRTRNETVFQKDLESNDHFVVDVGGKYDPSKLNFDHHQGNMTLTSKDAQRRDIPMSSTGLIFKFLVDNDLIDLSEASIEAIRLEFIVPIDAADNGIYENPISDFVSSFNRGDEENDDCFENALNVMIEYVKNIDYKYRQKEKSDEKTRKLCKSVFDRDGVKIIFDGLDDSDKEVVINQELAQKLVPDLDFIIYKKGDSEWNIVTTNDPLDMDNPFSQKNSVKSSIIDYFTQDRMNVLNKEMINGKIVFIHKNGFLSVIEGNQDDAFRWSRFVKSGKNTTFDNDIPF